MTDGGPARLFSPYVPKPPGAPAADTLPMMLYMPGIDGTGLAAYRQFPRLTRAFDLRCLIIPRTDRSTFDELTDYVAVSTQVAQQGAVSFAAVASFKKQLSAYLLRPCSLLAPSPEAAVNALHLAPRSVHIVPTVADTVRAAHMFNTRPGFDQG